MIRTALLVWLTLASALWAVEPDEVLDDPALEERARALSAELRCLVCRNESIDESSAELARDLRLLVRERLVAGDSDTEVMAFVVARYGEYVLLNPPVRGSTWLLWLSGPALALVSGALAWRFLKGRAALPEPSDALSGDEQARLRELLDDDRPEHR